ncbi:hypothetical protein HZS_4415 [Henneguya salminicola]|nr:hypothetical protein HZS_4415 [Henneguya salminicola]
MIIWLCDQEHVKHSGPRVIVKVDESLFRHKPKYHRGRATQNEAWVLGIGVTSFTLAKGYMQKFLKL